MARQGKFFAFSDLHRGLPESELRRRQAQMNGAFEAAAADPDAVVVLIGDTISGPFIPVEGPARTIPADPAFTDLVHMVADRLGFFLEMIDQCDIRFIDQVGDRLVFLVSATQEDHLDLIRNAIAGEHRMLSELGIDPHDVALAEGAIRIRVPVPATDDPH